MKTSFNERAMRIACLDQNPKSGLALAVGLALMLALDVATAGVATTRHNLGSTGTAGYNKFGGTTEVCVFCHTPHGSNISIAAPAPLWNRNFTTTTPYTTYASLGTTTLDGKVATTGSVSIACLSCHDGTQAMDIMINSPGSGTVFPAALAGSWSGTTQTAGKITGAYTNLGVDLTNDHPIGIQYCGGGVNVGALNGPCNDADFKLAPILQRSGAGASTKWWIETNGNTTREITDLPLYTRADTLDYLGAAIPGGANQPYVECASCHDPHNNNTTFLRVSNNGSVICLACHTK